VAAITFLGIMIGAFTGINEDGVAFGNMLVFNAADDRTDPAGFPVQLAMRLAASRGPYVQFDLRELFEIEPGSPTPIN
jgi:hypothetical protein